MKSQPLAPAQPQARASAAKRGRVDRVAAPAPEAGSPAGSGAHDVHLYEDEDCLLERLTRFVGAALGMGDAAVVLATTAHRTELATRLGARGLDLPAAIAQGRYAALDAGEVLAQIRGDDGQPDQGRFTAIVGGIVDRAAQAALGASPSVAVFGELVALLATAGDHAAAVALEHWWNELAEGRRFSLLCAYPFGAFPQAADSAPFAAICAAHDDLTLPDDPGLLRDIPARRRAIALLQQQAHALPDEARAREQAQAMLWRREAELSAIVTCSDDAIISKTLDGTITSWNHAAERLYGYTAAEIIGRPIATIVPEDRRAELAEIMDRLRRGERIAHHETVRVHKDGTRIDASVSISPILDHSGHIIGAAKIARDIRERRALERQKQEFVEMVAHDLGSPLTVIKGYAQLLQRRQGRDEPMAAKIVTEAERMRRLVGDMLEMTRLEAGRLELRLAPADLVTLARECTAQAALVAGDRVVRCEAPDVPVIGKWDRDRLEQVLMNLLDNALKYAPSGEVVVRVEAGEAEASVAVSDHGPGLTAEQRQLIFGRFTRLAETAASTQGTGLGLFISQRLVAAHGGRLWADAIPGHGTTFTVTLPLGPSVLLGAHRQRRGGAEHLRTASPTASA